LLFYITFAPINNAKIKKMLGTLLYSLLIIAIAMLLLGVRVMLKKNGSFQSQHISDNAYLKEKGIRCVIDQDKEARAKNKAY
jgi:putative membrane protein